MHIGQFCYIPSHTLYRIGSDNQIILPMYIRMYVRFTHIQTYTHTYIRRYVKCMTYSKYTIRNVCILYCVRLY